MLSTCRSYWMIRFDVALKEYCLSLRFHKRDHGSLVSLYCQETEADRAHEKSSSHGSLSNETLSNNDSVGQQRLGLVKLNLEESDKGSGNGMANADPVSEDVENQAAWIDSIEARGQNLIAELEKVLNDKENNNSGDDSTLSPDE